jgi:hypothetical protein
MKDMQIVFGEKLDLDFENFVLIDLPVVKEKIEGQTRSFGEIIFMGDFHYGHNQHSFSHLHKYLGLLEKRKHVQICMMGDVFEMQDLADFVKEAEVPERLQVEMFLSDFKPFAKRIKTLIWGNHEKRYAKQGKMVVDLFEYCKEKLENPDIYTAPPQRGILAAVKAGEQLYSVYMLHGRSKATTILDAQLRRSRGIWATTIIAHGHIHKMDWHPMTMFTVAGDGKVFGRLVIRQYLLSTGCFLRYPGYAEEGSLPVSDIGAPIVRFYADSCGVEYIDPRIRYKDYFLKGGEFYQHADVDCSDLLDFGFKPAIKGIPLAPQTICFYKLKSKGTVLPPC